MRHLYVKMRHIYEGHSICNETAQYIPKFYIYTLINTFIKMSVSWLNKCKIAAVQLLT